jgi:hypothetical protein
VGKRLGQRLAADNVVVDGCPLAFGGRRGGLAGEYLERPAELDAAGKKVR